MAKRKRTTTDPTYWPDDVRGGYWVEQPLEGGWWVSAHIVTDRGTAVVAEVKVFPGEGRGTSKRDRPRDPSGVPVPSEWSRTLDAVAETAPGGITVALLRKVRLGEIVTEGRRHAAMFAVADEATARANTGPAAEMAARLAVVEKRLAAEDTHRGLPDGAYLLWAARYAAKVESGSRRPLAELAREQDVERAWLRDVIYRARRKPFEYLTPTGEAGERRAGGQLTDKARSLIADMDEADGAGI